MEELTVACVFRPGSGFSGDYVHRLKAATEKFCAAPHRFVCLTTQKLQGVECVPLKRRNMGWWSKLELFRKGLFTGPVVYTDLDTVLVSDVTDIYTHPHEFTTGQNWNCENPSMATGFIAWDGRQDLSYLDGDAMPIKYPRGDQEMIQAELRQSWQTLEELFPGRFVSYKIHVRAQGKVPEGASIVAFHGRPRPHEIAWRLPA